MKTTILNYFYFNKKKLYEYKKRHKPTNPTLNKKNYYATFITQF